MDGARRAGARVVEGARGDELCTRRHADPGPGDDHARDLGAVARHVDGGAGVLPVGVEPAVDAASVASGQLGVRQVDARVEGRHRDPVPVHTLGPEGRSASRGDAGLSGDGIGGLDRQLRVGLDRLHVGARLERGQGSCVAGQRHRVRDPQRTHMPHVPLAAQLGELGEHRRLRTPALLFDLPYGVSAPRSPRAALGLGVRCTITAFIGTAATAWAGSSAAHASAMTTSRRIRPSASAGFRSARGSSRAAQSQGEPRGRSQGLDMIGPSGRCEWRGRCVPGGSGSEDTVHPVA